MSCHVVHLFCCAVKIDGIATFFVASGAGFSFIVWPLCGVLGGVLLQYSGLFRRVLGDMKQACFTSGRTIAWMACIFFLRLPARPVLGLVGEAVYSPFLFLP